MSQHHIYSRFQIALKMIRFYFRASNRKGHGIHSPWVFKFVKFVKNDKRHFYAYTDVEQLRKKLLKDETLLEVEDFGAGSMLSPKKMRSVQAITTHAAKHPTIARLLFRMAQFYQPGVMIELGTSLGLTSAYLAKANLNGVLYTLEGSAQVLEKANMNFQQLQLPNIITIPGNFDDTLPKLVQSLSTVDFAFIDGNHRYEPTIRYFRELLTKAHDQTILVFDDIHWSNEMERAWSDIQQDSRVTLTIDLFFIGIVVLDKGIRKKQHFLVNW